uniref:Voltage-gated hydrogen channel 1 n=1 Tax=Ciona savignyi TaxID=51511 RepID=H2Z728_CIOSA
MESDNSNKSRHKSHNMINPNYASVRCTQPLPSVIQLRSRSKSSMGGITEDPCSSDSDHVPTSQPLLLTNLSYEVHTFNDNNNHEPSVTQPQPQNTMIPLQSNKPKSGQFPASNLGMFQYMKFERRDSDEDVVDQEDEPILNNREKLKHILHSKPIHIAIIVLVVLDSFLVIGELLIDLKIIIVPHGNPAPEILHGFSLSILSIFMVEIALKIIADPHHFIRHKVEVLDAVVVVISFGVDIALIFVGESEALAALGLLVILRLWRVFRIINGIIVTVKTKADERVHEIKQKNSKLEAKIEDLKEKLQEKDKEITSLHEIMKRNGIEVPPHVPPSTTNVQVHDYSASSV